MDSSHALDLPNAAERSVVEPPPSVSFRTKSSKPSLTTDSVAQTMTESTPDSSVLSASESPPEPKVLSEGSDRSMSEFYQLRNHLSLSTLLWTVACLIPVWFFYDGNIALNYLLGAIAGLIYLRLLARNVERLGSSKQVGKSQLAVFIGVIIIATQVSSLHVLPVFLGFLTYKVSILVYAFRTAVLDS